MAHGPCLEGNSQDERQMQVLLSPVETQGPLPLPSLQLIIHEAWACSRILEDAKPWDLTDTGKDP